MAGSRDEVEEALGVAVDAAGPGVLTEPRRLRAVLADLVGTPASDHRDEIGALVAGAEVTSEDKHTDEDDVVAELVRQEINPELARWATAALARHGARIGSTPRTIGATRRRRRRWAVAALVVVPLAVLAMALLPPHPDPPDPDPAADDLTTSSGSAPTSPTTLSSTEDTPSSTSPTEVTAWRAEFAEAPEGVLLTSRTWDIEDGQLSGTVTLIPTGDAGLATHRELVPSEGFVDPTFDPEPSNVSGDVATFVIDQTAGTQTITFEAELTEPEPDEATVQSWYDAWRGRVNDLTPLEDQPPADVTITPPS